MDTKKTERDCLAQSAIHSTSHRARYITKTAGIFLGGALSLLTAQSALAGDVAWIGGTDTSWQTGTNWTGGTPAAGANVASFNVGTNLTVASGSAVTVEGLSFGSEAGAFSLTNSSDMILTASGIVNASGVNQNIVNDAAGTLTLQAGDVATGVEIANNGTLEITNAAAVTVDGDIVNNSAFNVNNTADVTINKAITGVDGTLTKSGTGNLVLVGDSTLNGGVTVNAGTLQLGNGTDAGTVSGGVTVNTDATLVINPGSNDFTIAEGQTFDGAGKISWSGTGNFTLVGTDNASETTINSGIFQVGDGVASDAVATLGSDVKLGNGTQLIFDNAPGADDTYTYSHVISDASTPTEENPAGTVEIKGSGTTVFTGTNMYSGKTTVDDYSTLQLGNGSATGKVAGDVELVGYDSELVIKPNTADTADYVIGKAQTISGDFGSVSWEGTASQTLRLLGTDSAGITTINNGHFIVGNHGTTAGAGNLAGNVVLGAGAKMSFDNPTADADNPFVYSHVISDAADVTSETAGTVSIDSNERLIFTGNNTYLGQTIINGTSILQLGGSFDENGASDGTSGSITGNVNITRTDADTAAGLEFHRSDNVNYTGVISGGGNLSQSGAGILTLSGDSSAFAGTTTVDAGTLLIGGSPSTTDGVLNTTAKLGGNVTVNKGATLGGFGTIGGNVTVADGGDMSPGASIGTVTVNGNYTQETGSTYTVEVNAAGQSDSLVVGGTATIQEGSNLVVDITRGFDSSNPYTILDAGTLTAVDGAFSTVTVGSNAFIGATPVFNSIDNTVELKVAFSADAFHNAYDTPNQTAVGNYLLETDGTVEIQNLVASLDTDAQLQKALDQISGATYANQILQIGQVGRWFDSQMADRMDFYPKCTGVTDPKSSQTWPNNCAAGKSVWVLPYGSSASIDTDEVGGLDTSMGGVAIGADYVVAPNVIVGAAVAGTYFSSDAEGNEDASADGTLYQFGVYGSYVMNKDWTLGASVSVGGTNDIDATRTINTASGTTTTNGSYSSTVISEQLRLSYDRMVMNKIHVKPFIGLVGQQVNSDSFTETGDPDFALNVSDLDYNSFRIQTGSAIEVPVGSMTLLGSVAWQHELGDDQGSFTAYINSLGGANSFNVVGTDIGSDSALIKAGVVLLEKGRMNVTALYEGMFANNYSENGGRLQLDFDLG